MIWHGSNCVSMLQHITKVARSKLNTYTRWSLRHLKLYKWHLIASHYMVQQLGWSIHEQGVHIFHWSTSNEFKWHISDNMETQLLPCQIMSNNSQWKNYGMSILLFLNDSYHQNQCLSPKKYSINQIPQMGWCLSVAYLSGQLWARGGHAQPRAVRPTGSRGDPKSW